MAERSQSGGLNFLRAIKEHGYTELIADPNSGTVQFGRFAFRLRKTSGELEGLLGYRRSFDFDEENGTGQDFAVLRGDDQHTVGVLSDGVSQSFFGDMAAIHVSRFLVRYLWNVRRRPPSKHELERELKGQESEVAKIISSRAIAQNLAPMVRAALDRKRPSGSQAVFAAFLLDNLKQILQVYLCGDVRVVVRSEGQQPVSVRADPDGRWSSAGASDMRLKFQSHSRVEAISLASDGVRDDWNLEIVSDQNSPVDSSFHAMAQEQAAKDDVSFVSVRFLRGTQAAQPEAHVQTEAQQAYVTWVDGVDTVVSAQSPKPEIEEVLSQSSSAGRTPQPEQSGEAVRGAKRKSWWAAGSSGRFGLALLCLGLLVGAIARSGFSFLRATASGKQAGHQVQMAPSVNVRFSVINEFDVMKDFIDDVSPPVGAATIEFVSDTPDLHARLGYMTSENRQARLEVGPFESRDKRYFAACKIEDLPETKTRVSIGILDSGDREVKTLEGWVEEGHVYKVSVERAGK